MLPRLLLGGDEITADAGEVMPLAGGMPHTVRNESGADAVAFVVHAPGAPMEQFIRAVVAESAHGTPSMDAVLAIAARNGIEFLGPARQPPRAAPDRPPGCLRAYDRGIPGS